eukprot:TRINITY_DN89327_c0_g1_i1.p1 TRINITY_DN89327_c0_g1~~TRINITY_DN89327_c0_g1_i1.p1  ORF type:complete len:1106 (-),score=246.44 TRINITY_DN89327_c0_g1_i1:147-3464(-)
MSLTPTPGCSQLVSGWAFVFGKGALKKDIAASSGTENSSTGLDSLEAGISTSTADDSGAVKLLLAALGLGCSGNLAGSMNRRGSLCGRFCRRKKRNDSKVRALKIRVQMEGRCVERSASLPELPAGCVDMDYDAFPGGNMLALTPVNRDCMIPQIPSTPLSARHRWGAASCPTLSFYDTPDNESPMSKPGNEVLKIKPSTLQHLQASSSDPTPSSRRSSADAANEILSPTSPTSPTSPSSPEHLQQWHVPQEEMLEFIFNEIDISGSGYLDREGLGQALQLAEQRCAFPATYLGLQQQVPSVISTDSSAVDVASNDVSADSVASGRADRLFTLLATRHGQALVVKKKSFIAGMQDLCEVANCLRGLSAKQFLEVLLLAFERFDENADGLLSAEEFAAALTSLGLESSPRAQQMLHALLDTDGDGFIEHAAADTTELERWVKAFKTSMEIQVQRRAQKIMPLVESLQEAVAAKKSKESSESDEAKEQAPITDGLGAHFRHMHRVEEHQPQGKFVVGGNLVQQAWEASHKFIENTSAALFERAEAVADAVECSLDVTGTVLALQGLARGLEGATAWEAVNLGDLAPFLAFLGVTGLHVTREFNRSEPAKDLSADEAMLYVQSFQGLGFSVSEFRELLKAGFSWVDAPKGSLVDVSSHLLVVLRGSCQLQKAGASSVKPGLVKAKAKTGVQFGLGAVFVNGVPVGSTGPWQQGTLKAGAPLRCAAWDQAALEEYLDIHPEAKQRMAALVTQTKTVQHAKSAFHAADGDCSGFLDASSLRAALRIFIKRNEQELQLKPTEKVVQYLSDLLFATETGTGTVSKERFVSQLQELATGLTAVHALTVQQVHEITLHAIQYLGHEEQQKPLPEEFAAAFQKLQLDMPKGSANAMHLALEHGCKHQKPMVQRRQKLPAQRPGHRAGRGSKESTKLRAAAAASGEGPEELPDACRLVEAFKAAMQEQWRRKGLDRLGSSLQGLLDGGSAGIHPGCQEVGQADSIQSKLNALSKGIRSMHAVTKDPELLQDGVETSLDIVAFLTASSRLSLELCGQSSWSDLDASTVVPLLLFAALSGVYMVRDLSGTKHSEGTLQPGKPPMSEDSASHVTLGRVL